MTKIILGEAGAGGEADEQPDVPDCLACGACCFSSLETYVRVSGDDHERMGDRAERVTHFIENRCYMSITDGHCAALSIEPGASPFVCTIYGAHPSICRDLERGSPPCLFEHATKVDRSAAALRRQRR